MELKLLFCDKFRDICKNNYKTENEKPEISQIISNGSLLLSVESNITAQQVLCRLSEISCFSSSGVEAVLYESEHHNNRLQLSHPIPSNSDKSCIFVFIEEPPSIRLYVRNLSCKTTEVNICPLQTIENIKKIITEEEGIPVQQQRLIFNGKQLDDKKMIGEYGIMSESTIHLVLRLGMMVSENGKNNFNNFS